MKTFFLVLCLIITSRLANATTQTKFNPDKPPRLYVKEYTVTDETTQIPFEPEYWSDTPIYSRDFSTWQDELDSHADTEMDWEDGGIDFINCYWPAATWPDLQGGTKVFVMPNRPNWTNSTTTPAITWEHCILKESGTLFDSTLLRERTAQTKILMETGGKTGVSRQNLFNISGEATKIPAKAWVFSPYGIVSSDSPTAIPPEQVSISDFGNLGNDGRLWHDLPDNSPPIVITPYVNGNDFYTFNLGAQKYKLQIVVNGSNPLWPDRVPSRNTFCVGQYLIFEPHWTPGMPPFTDAVAHWTLPGTYVNEKPFSYCDGFYDKNSALLNRIWTLNKDLATGCWYVDGFQAQNANVGINMFFPNGQTAFANASGKINVYKPSILFTTNDNSSLPTVEIDDSPDTGPNSMMVGHPGGLGSMKFHAHIESSVPGEAIATQLINSWWEALLHNSLSIGPFGTSGDLWLDKNQQMGYSALPLIGMAYSGDPTVFDQPATQLLVPPYYPYYSLSRSDSFKDYFRFRPIGDGNIYVTLGIATWNWYGNAYEDSYLTHWTLTSGTVAEPSVSESQEFPFWKYTY